MIFSNKSDMLLAFCEINLISNSGYYKSWWGAHCIGSFSDRFYQFLPFISDFWHQHQEGKTGFGNRPFK